ncbi:histidine kinase [Lentilactobacillus fungorum]|uniref:Histidine kinase n=1 Tax=Lentilactobacillus fungorum TaxID=2201250 RepID=A0ABQ3VZ41_9LACO|nr:DUF3021 domain-containing protein [Lentilactobacillus fungorum]GHP14163.1 histidine kinase [Lentilactobacillus fungorum]
MIKKFSIQTIVGIVSGVFIGFVLSLIFSLLNGAVSYSPSTPKFVAQFNGSLSATVFSALLWALMGIVFAVGSLIFTITDWSIAKMTIVHLAVTYFGFLPLAILAGWFPLNFVELGGFTIIFIVVYIAIYITSMIVARKEAESLNQKLRER